MDEETYRCKTSARLAFPGAFLPIQRLKIDNQLSAATPSQTVDLDKNAKLMATSSSRLTELSCNPAWVGREQGAINYGAIWSLLSTANQSLTTSLQAALKMDSNVRKN